MRWRILNEPGFRVIGEEPSQNEKQIRRLFLRSKVKPSADVVNDHFTHGPRAFIQIEQIR